jgi:tetratricopeptide (TPR) repeat protein
MTKFATKACKSLEETAVHLVRIGDWDSAVRVADIGIRETRGAPPVGAYWVFRFVRAEVLRHRGRAKEALEYLCSLGSPLPEDLESQTRLTMHLGYCSASIGRYEAAHALLREAEASAIRAELPEVQAEITLRRAMLAYVQRDFDGSERLYRSVANIYGDRFGWYLLCIARAGVGKSLMARREFREALPWLEEAVSTAEAAGSKYLTAVFSGEAGICYLGLGDPDRALRIYVVADGIFADLGTRHAYQVNLADMGNVYLHKGEYVTAISLYQRALAIAKEIDAPESVEKWSCNIRLAYAKLRQSMAEDADRA